jgi:hypothetical protein
MMSKTGPAHIAGAASSTAERETFNLTVQGSIPWRPTPCVAGAIGQRTSLLTRRLPVRVRGGALTLRWSKRTPHQALNLEAAGSSPARSTHDPRFSLDWNVRIIDVKTCGKCKIEKPLTEFFRRGSGHQAW